mgnify:CR=1 FL=1
MEFLDSLGLREWVIGIAVLLGIYSGILMLRLSRVARSKPAEAVWTQSPADFGGQMVASGIEAELAELRGEVDALKGEVAQLKAARNVSPQYGEAVALAQKGMAAQQIAERCGISVAEAEMVCALSGRQAG